MAGRINYRNPDERLSDERFGLAREKFDYQQARDAMAQAAKATEMEAKAQHYQQQFERGEQRLAIGEAERALAQERIGIAEANHRLAETAAKAKELETGAALTDAERFLTQSIDLDPSADDFDSKFLKLQASTLRASKHPEVAARAKYLGEKRMEALTLKKQQALYEDAVEAGLVPKTAKVGDITMGRPSDTTVQQDVMAIKPPDGMEVERYETDSAGKTRAVFKPVQEKVGFRGTPEEARAYYGPDASIHETSKGVWTSTIKPVVAATGFRGTADEARERYGPDATLHETDKGVWTVTIKPKEQTSFRGTIQEAREHYGPGATIHETAKGVWTATEKPTTQSGKAETWKSWGEDLKAAIDAHGGESKVPASVWAQFEERKKALGGTGSAPNATASGPSKIASAADFNALPSGAEFIDPQGVRRRKP